MRRKFFSYSFLFIMLFVSGSGSATALDDLKPHANESSPKKEGVSSLASLRVHLTTATGKTIVFKAAEHDTEAKIGTASNEIPHLVLNRNGNPTPAFERTLLVSVENLNVPPSGMYVQLVLETQHGDPDLDRKNNVRIRVWKETKFIPYSALHQQVANVQFNVTFDPLTELPHQIIKTPTDYYRCRIVISDAQGNPLQSYVEEYALLMENQWRVPLPKVLEMTPGAAPNQLLVYYYDMIPFQTNLRNPDSRIPREDVGRYIQTELVPAMAEAFRVQSDVWGFPWYAEWRNFRREEDPKTLSVALGENLIWYHGKPASLGHSMISIRVDGTAGEYANLTDGLMSTFHHELFHNHQRNLSLHFGKQAEIAGKDDAWMMFTEGTAVLASSVGQPDVQFEATAQLRSYLKRANAFIGTEGAIGGGLNKSYKEIPYHTAFYWRFLYENCGSISQYGEDPHTGMQVIRRALEVLYQGEIVEISKSTDVAEALPAIMDAALRSTPSCKFHTYEESLVHFARAIYMLRLSDGRCLGLIDGSTCGFIDAHHLYQTPPADIHSIAASTFTEINGSIPSSYGIDFVELELSPSVEGKTLTLMFTSATDPASTYHVELWKTRTIDESGVVKRRSVQTDEPVSVSTENGRLIVEIENLGDKGFDGLGLIITRTDPFEDTQASGTYSMKLIAK